MGFIEKCTLDLNNLEVVDTYIFSDWDELICEHDGHYSSDDQYIIFKSNGIEMCVNFELSVTGYYIYDEGDYWTPPSSDSEITDVEINIGDVLIDDSYELTLNKETLNLLTNKIKTLIK
jgi:hypothetical protein